MDRCTRLTPLNCCTWCRSVHEISVIFSISTFFSSMMDFISARSPFITLGILDESCLLLVCARLGSRLCSTRRVCARALPHMGEGATSVGGVVFPRFPPKKHEERVVSTNSESDARVQFIWLHGLVRATKRSLERKTTSSITGLCLLWGSVPALECNKTRD